MQKAILPKRVLEDKCGSVSRISGYFMVLCFFSVGICAAQSNTENDRPTKVASKNYRIGSGDVLKIVVAKQDLLSLDSVRVSNEGTIRLPMLEGEISAACLTEAELGTVLTGKYKKYLLNPQVYVAVQEFNSNPVAVLGAVNSPGRFDIRRSTTLLELLTLVNGPSAVAGPNIQIFRRKDTLRCNEDSSLAPETENDQELFLLPLAETMKGNDAANPLVKAGDIITLIKADEPGEVYVVGNVKSAKNLPLKEPITLSKAIVMAGGVTSDAKTDKIKITRQDSKSLAKTVIMANLKEINKGNQVDILLQANDIVEVPGPSGSGKVLRDIFKTIVPTLTRGIIPVY